MCSLVAQVETSSVNALADPATGITASSKFGTLQLDRSEYDVTYVNNTVVKVSGTITTLDSINKLVTILFTLPDGTTKGSQIAYNGDGTFQTSFPLDSNSQKGTYSVSASYAQNTFGALTFTVKLVPVSKSALPISPPPIKPTQNNSSLPTTNNQQNVPSQSIPNSITQSPSKLPKWIKSTFILYAQGEISEDELLNAIKFLVQNNIIKIQSVSQSSPPASTSSSTTINPSPTQTIPSTSTNNTQQNISIQSLFPQQTELSDGWIVGNLTLSKEPDGGWLEDWYQSYTNNNDNEKIHVEIAKYASNDKAQQWVSRGVSGNLQNGAIAVTPDDSIKDNCSLTDMHMGSTNGPLSTMFICQKGEYAIEENPFASDNSDQVKQDMTKLVQIILNKIPHQTSGQSQSNNISQPLISSQSDLVQLFPTYNDGITWSPRDGKDTSYQDDAGDHVQAYEKNYVKSQDMGSGAITVGIKKFTSTDKAKTNTDNFISRVKSEAKSGFSDINGFGFPSECQGIKEDFGLEERNGIFCTKNNFSIYVTGLGSLYGLDDEATNFAKIVLTKIG